MKKTYIAIAVIILIAVFYHTQVISYNQNTHKYHRPTCEWALKCTDNCHITLKFLVQGSKRPCKVCGG